MSAKMPVKIHPMTVMIEEKWELVNPSPSVKSAVIFRYSDGTIVLSVIRDLGKGDQGSVKGYKTITSAKMLYARRYHTGNIKPAWRKVK